MTSLASTTDKLRGGYYTPEAVARWLAAWAIRSPDDRVLEPSSGDGVFLGSALEVLGRFESAERSGATQVIGIELVPEEARKSKKRAQRTAESDCVRVVQGDFFGWLETNQLASFDVVIGNPPFIRYQNFPEPSRTKAMDFMESEGLHPNRLTNIWVPFVVGSTALLREGGRLAMVLPAELLQVTYAAQLRRYLADSFERITIFACNEMFFEKAEQEVLLVLAEGKLGVPDASNRCDIAIVQADSLDELLATPPTTKRRRGDRKVVQHETEKWLKFFLSGREIEFMRSLRAHRDIGILSDHASVDVGVVTGRNEFFVLDNNQVEAHGLREFVVPLVGRASQLAGTVLRKRELANLAVLGRPVYLLHLAGRDGASLPHRLKELIASGESRGFHLGYKCSIRTPWYQVPAVWEPQCFFFRQIHDFPRAVLNQAGATSTDTIHRMRCKGPAARVAANIYTHLTAASAEIEGRSYGGGVLELEPTEAERLLLPRELNGAMPIQEADRYVRAGRLDTVLESNDRAVLRSSLGLSVSDCAMLKRIWDKMRDRRMARGRR